MLEVRRCHDERPLALAHLLAADGEKSVDVDFRRQREAGRFEHPGPEERVELRDVFADEVVDFSAGRLPPVVELLAISFAPFPSAGDVADGGVEPDVPVIAGRIGDFETKIGRGPRNVPVAERLTEEMALQIISK